MHLRAFWRDSGVSVRRSRSELLAFLIDQQGGLCFYCQTAPVGGLSLEHVVPTSRGGEHTLENTVAACFTCNCSKNDSTLLEWVLWKLNGCPTRRRTRRRSEVERQRLLRLHARRIARLEARLKLTLSRLARRA